MVCKKCIENPVINLTNNNIQLCKNCFIKYFEKKVLKTIRIFNLIGKNDKIVVAVSGGKDSLTVLHILNMLSQERRNFSLIALAIDEGIKGYREDSLKHLKKFCENEKVELKIVSFKDNFGKTLDETIPLEKNQKPCSVCGVFRRTLMNKYAKTLGATKLATGHNLDDESQSILMNQFKSNLKTSARMGPVTGIVNHERFIKRIKPLYLVTEKEVGTYAFIKGFMDKFNECPYEGESYRAKVRDLLNDFEAKFPGTKHNIIKSFLDILPTLKEKFKGDQPIKSCKECGEPCSGKTCKACEKVNELFNDR